mgnify:CR=1 FL=1
MITVVASLVSGGFFVFSYLLGNMPSSKLTALLLVPSVATVQATAIGSPSATATGKAVVLVDLLPAEHYQR